MFQELEVKVQYQFAFLGWDDLDGYPLLYVPYLVIILPAEVDIEWPDLQLDISLSAGTHIKEPRILVRAKSSGLKEFVLIDGEINQDTYDFEQPLHSLFNGWFVRICRGGRFVSQQRTRQGSVSQVESVTGMQSHIDYQTYVDGATFRMQENIESRLYRFRELVSNRETDVREPVNFLRTAWKEDGRSPEYCSLTKASEEVNRIYAIMRRYVWHSHTKIVRALNLGGKHTTQQRHETIVASFLNLQAYVYSTITNMASDMKKSGGNTPECQHHYARLKQLWVDLRDSHVFEFPSQAYTSLVDEIIKTLSSNPESWLHLEQFNSQVKFPEEFPFPKMYFAWDVGIPFTLGDAPIIGFSPPENIRHGNGILLATLVTEQQTVWNFIMMSRIDPERGEHIQYYLQQLHGKERGWFHNRSNVAWLVRAVVDNIIEHRKIIEETRIRKISDKSAFKKARARIGIRKPIPPPFYAVNLRDEVLRQPIQTFAPGPQKREFSFQFDVEGHERVYVRRGQLPLSDKDKRSLIDRGYQVYEWPQGPAEEHLRALSSRGHALIQEGEWVGVKRTWVEAHRRPLSPDLPYVPSTRRATKGPLSGRSSIRRPK